MAKVLVEVDDKFIDWDAWARSQLSDRGMVSAVDEANYQTNAEEQGGRPDDPWAGTNTTTRRGDGATSTQTTTAPQGNAAVMTGTKTISTPSGEQQVTFSPAGGPQCNCGDPAALFSGISQKTNKRWRAYRCAKSAGENWRDKCEFSQWS